MPILGVIASSKAKAAPSWDSISTLTMNGNNSVTFTNIPQTYKHLHLRVRGQVTYSAAVDWFRGLMQVNGVDAAYVQTLEWTAGTMNSTYQANAYFGFFPGNASEITDYKGAAFADFLDYTGSQTKTAVTAAGQCLASASSNSYSGIGQLVFNTTSAITNITVYVNSTNFRNSTFSLYGIKG